MQLQKRLTLEEQYEELAALVDTVFVKTSRFVKGPFTSSDYVTWKLNQIFTPSGWSFTLLSGPDVVSLSTASAYVRTVGRLSVRFADGTEAHKDEAGITPMYGTREQDGSGRMDLDNTAPEVHETALKASVSDCLKACAERLGQCFRPLIDQDLEYHIRTVMPLTGRESHGSAEEAIADLFDVKWEADTKPPTKATTPAPQKATVSAANAQRPYAPDKVREKAQVMANNGNKITATEAQRNLIRGKLSECFAGDPDADKKRHTALAYLFGIESTRDPRLTRGHVDAIVKWVLLDGQKDATGDYPLHPNAPAEAAAIVRQALIDAGQQELEL